MSSAPSTKKEHLVPGEFISSDSVIYLVESILGEGTFGKVAKCKRMNEWKTVAIKSVKEEKELLLQAKREVGALSKLKKLDPDKCNIVRWYGAFSHWGHYCLEFEQLDKSLYDFMRQRSFRPLIVWEIRLVVQQLANALYHLKAVGIIHANLNLKNVMLVNHGQEPYRVKLTDFGQACEMSATTPGLYIHTCEYRSPEIMLALMFTEAIDMWSLGCLAAELYLGSPLYPGSNDYDRMRHIVATQGLPRDTMLEAGCKTDRFFIRDVNSTTSLWKFKTPEQFYREREFKSRETRMLKFSSLDDLICVQDVSPYNYTDKSVVTVDLQMFVDMLKKMLQLDPTHRITPRQVLEHDFIMCHIAKMYPLSFYAWASFEAMKVCQTSGKAVCRSLQQPPSRTTTATAGMTKWIHLNYIHPLPCTGTQITTSIKSGRKRNATNLTARVSKRTKDQGMHRPAGLSTSSTSRDPSYIRSALRSHSAQQPCQSSGNQSCIRPGFRRKMAAHEDYNYYERSGHEKMKISKSSEARGTYSRSGDNSTHTLHIRPDGRRGVPPIRRYNGSHRASSNRTESLALSGVNSRTSDGDNGWLRRRTSNPRSEIARESYRERLRRPREPHINEMKTHWQHQRCH